MTKTIAMLAISATILFSCTNNQNQKKESADNTPVPEKAVGGDKDEHGCLGAAGETWSELRQSCIRLFEDGVRLNPTVKKEGEAVLSAFVVFNDDKSKLELFLPGGDSKSSILDKADGEVYQDATYRFDAKENALYINGKKEYQAS